MSLDVNMLIQLAVYLVSIAAVAGALMTRIKSMEEKVEKHNSLIERMYVVEESVKNAHVRIDELREERKDDRKEGCCCAINEKK